MFRLIITTLTLLLTFSMPAIAGTTGPGATAVRSANDKIATLLKQKPAAGSKEEKDLAATVTSSVRDFLDIDELGKRAMTDQWDKLTPAQQKIFQEAADVSDKWFAQSQSEAVERMVEAYKKAGAQTAPLSKQDFDAWIALAKKTSWP
jgi:hypothetical protein